MLKEVQNKSFRFDLGVHFMPHRDYSVSDG
jgi:hypothetical protein